MPGNSVAGSVFALASLAEQAMADAGLTDEEQDEVFLELSPDGFTDYGPRVYAAHAAELCARKKAGEDLRPGTKAEAVVALSEMSLKVPLAQQYCALYEQLFVEVFGAASASEALGELGGVPEPWQGACDELLAEMRKKLARVRAPKE